LNGDQNIITVSQYNNICNYNIKNLGCKRSTALSEMNFVQPWQSPNRLRGYPAGTIIAPKVLQPAEERSANMLTDHEFYDGSQSSCGQVVNCTSPKTLPSKQARPDRCRFWTKISLVWTHGRGNLGNSAPDDHHGDQRVPLSFHLRPSTSRVFT
jgi:hypothetical protein